MNIKYYYFIDEFNKKEIEKLTSEISLIYRNYHKKNDPKELKKLVIHCKNSRRKVYISNNLKDAIKYNFDGLYIPSFYKQLKFQNITKKQFKKELMAYQQQMNLLRQSIQLNLQMANGPCLKHTIMLQKKN